MTVKRYSCDSPIGMVEVIDGDFVESKEYDELSADHAMICDITPAVFDRNQQLLEENETLQSVFWELRDLWMNHYRAPEICKLIGRPFYPNECHPSHKTHTAEPSDFGEICLECGAWKGPPGGWGNLRYPCRPRLRVVREKKEDDKL